MSELSTSASKGSCHAHSHTRRERLNHRSNSTEKKRATHEESEKYVAMKYGHQHAECLFQTMSGQAENAELSLAEGP